MGNLIKLGRQAYDKVRGLIRFVGRKTNNIDNRRMKCQWNEGMHIVCRLVFKFFLRAIF